MGLLTKHSQVLFKVVVHPNGEFEHTSILNPQVPVAAGYRPGPRE